MEKLKIKNRMTVFCAAGLLVFAVVMFPACSSSSGASPDGISGYAEQIGTAAVLVLKDNRIVYSYGDIEKKYMCHSIRKPLLGALYGVYADRGLIDINLTLGQLGIDDIPPALTPEEKQATIRDLLLARSGVYHEAGGEARSMRDARPGRGSHSPGTFFYYNNWDFNALGTIFTQLTGHGVFEAFETEIARKIGMQDFSAADCSYVYEYDRSIHPSYFFRMSARDMARFGRLYQQGGRWEGKQIIPEAWIRESTSEHPGAAHSGDPYGYLWRIIREDSGFGGGFYHTGLGVHLLAVLPGQRIVAVHRVDTDRPFDTRWSGIRTLFEMIISSYGLIDEIR